ncbi:MAG: type II secretion system F family protein [Anaerolineae bacterium]|nr:type II secretion system F family protein [Anaerolineae bacterium]
MNPAALMLAFMVMLSITLISVGLSNARTQSVVEVRLAQYGSRTATLADLELERSFAERVIRPAFGRLARALAAMAPQASLARTRRQLELAGNPAGLRAVDFIGLRFLSGLATGAVVFLLTQALALGIGAGVVFGLLLGTLGYMLPVMWLGSRIRQRKQEILRALPDALDLLTISVEAGLGFDAALAKVVEKWDNALTYEFGRVLAEVRVGKLRREALRDMAERVEVPEVKSFVAAIIQADQLGASIGRILHVQAAQMRMKRRQRAEEAAQKAPIKMLIPLAFLIMPALFIVLLGPAVITVKNSGVLSLM